MRLWTVQPVVVWEQLQSDGFVYVDPFQRECKSWIPSAYNWLAWQIGERIANSSGHLPWFAYCERPDLRWVRHSRPKASREVLIEFEPPSDAFLAFPCWAWGHVYSGWYLSSKGMEARHWYSRLRAATGINFWDRGGLLPEPWQGELESSWRRLFDPALPPKSWQREKRYDASREAVVEVLDLNWVRHTREFVGAGTWVYDLPSIME